jgi:RNA polymerase sigma-70 factor (ECF subfamily)
MRPELSQAVDLLRRNTPEAIGEAIGLLQNTVYSFSMKVCGHAEDAEDTTQEVLFQSLDHLAKIHDPQALAVWLYTVTKNRCWRMRKKPAHAPSQAFSLDELMPDAAELGRLLQDTGESPEDHLLHAEQDHLLHQAVLHIPAQLRIVLVLCDMEELTTGQVAQVLNLQPGTVRVRLHRARLSVRREMNKLLEVAPRKVGGGNRVKKKSKDILAHNEQRSAECRELFANLSEYLDGRVEPKTCEAMRGHIEACPTCIAFLRKLRAAIDQCRSLAIPCDPAVSSRPRAILTKEYMRLLGMTSAEKPQARL